MTSRLSEIRLVLLGFGNVNQELCRIISTKSEQLRLCYGVNLNVVGVSDSRHALFNRKGFNLSSLVSTKQKEKTLESVASQQSVSKYTDTLEMMSKNWSNFELLVDSSPMNLQTGEPGLSCVRQALKRGKQVVLANKSPLVVAFDELTTTQDATKSCWIKYSATTCGGLPVINVITRDLMTNKNKPMCHLKKIEGIFNSTTNFILTQMFNHAKQSHKNTLAENNGPIHKQQHGSTFDRTLQEAIRRGIAEADPSNDIKGFDTCAKLYIILKSFGVRDIAFEKMKDQYTRGIDLVDDSLIQSALRQGKVIRLIAKAFPQPQSTQTHPPWNISVSPELVDEHSFLGRCEETDMCIQIETDLFDTISMKTNEWGVTPTAAAVLRDILSFVTDHTMQQQKAKL
ncbi:homoserine dehydrogenase [Reticulomyxa filosa]|uniref:Homoserine dehydrogenase n=1 Tax=Reticulomyxa filosa TaxID=46433 RepID=X6M5I6_RETFI|nr:homoserine dehydrogenase [Reticulomyxa filosa]|eukprot:ETO08295.1 homoserine dehydrogenase [Reticulomyxa filosa]